MLHIIDSLGRGGAEMLLVGTIKSTPEFNHVIISLRPLNEFTDELKFIKVYFLNFRWYHSLPSAISKVKKIISENSVDIIHAHLFWSVIISRLVCPTYIKLINSYHAMLYGKTGGANYPFYARLLDELTYSNRIVTLCVSEQVKSNIKQYVGIEENVYVLYNFIENTFFDKFRISTVKSEKIRLVAVGNLKKDKNYTVVLEALAQLGSGIKDCVTLDIYGSGPLMEELKLMCKYKNLNNVQLKGSVNNISMVLPNYDVYIISSTSEGFGLAVVEAMAVGLPVIASNIQTLREVTGGHAIYFNPLSSTELSSKIGNIMDGKYNLQELATLAHQYAKKYSKEVYLDNLRSIYLSR
ncbi:glycosyltransferase [Adhaeribacter pallidiroseus]|uniref:glycosyltransferase n=1 Tax=Adhaeribacter pallidiroseus TaxID=2072847 RepID=UPI001314BF7D|nr:glycosyltransferase [Adhaeribacter pallidiroseus]